MLCVSLGKPGGWAVFPPCPVTALLSQSLTIQCWFLFSQRSPGKSTVVVSRTQLRSSSSPGRARQHIGSRVKEQVLYVVIPLSAVPHAPHLPSSCVTMGTGCSRGAPASLVRALQEMQVALDASRLCYCTKSQTSHISFLLHRAVSLW